MKEKRLGKQISMKSEEVKTKRKRNSLLFGDSSSNEEIHRLTAILKSRYGPESINSYSSGVHIYSKRILYDFAYDVGLDVLIYADTIYGCEADHATNIKLQKLGTNMFVIR